MTENEAKEYMEDEIRCLQRASYCDRDCAKCELVKEEEPLIEAFGMAIQALEEIQAYRELGTVEGIVNLFNNQRTIIATQHEALAEKSKELRALKDAEEQGLILHLPCKVGTPVYMIASDCGGDTLDCRYRDCEGCSYLYSFVEENKFDTYMVDDIGKTVFLTKEEAEQALQKMKEGAE